MLDKLRNVWSALWAPRMRPMTDDELVRYLVDSSQQGRDRYMMAAAARLNELAHQRGEHAFSVTQEWEKEYRS